MISLLTPTRHRPDRFMQMAKSAYDQAFCTKNVEIVAYIADEDSSYDDVFPLVKTAWNTDFGLAVRGPRFPAGGTFSDLWNALIPHAHGDIFMQCADDVFFKTPGWDVAVEKAYADCPDKILLVYADDLGPSGKTFASLPFVSRRWVEVVGYFTGPGFAADFSDAWPQDVAEMIGRKKFLPGVEIEHRHHLWKKAVKDEVYIENEKRYREQRSSTLYTKRIDERHRDAAKLKAAIAEFQCLTKGTGA